MSWWVACIAGWVLALCWIASGLRMVWFFSRRTLDLCAGKLSDPEDWPRISVIVAARNEAHTIEPSLSSIAGMDYPNLEVIAVNDRSSDGTGKIMERIAAEAANARFLHINHLPDNWLGKCHALHRGALRASGDLLLFTDGDVRFASDTLRLAVRFFISDRCDHLVLCPRMTSRNYWEDAVKSFFALAFFTATRAWAVSGHSRRAYIGIGAFNLVSREAYERIGGHESLRLEVADDLMLGQRVKQHGYRQNVLIAPNHLRLNWVEGVGGFVKGLEKNAFASLNFSIPRLLGATGLMLLFNAVPYLGLLAFRDARISGYFTAVLTIHTVFGWCTSRNEKGWRLLPAFPIAAGTFLWTLWRSAFVTLRRGGILWRDTFYPIRILKGK